MIIHNFRHIMQLKYVILFLFSILCLNCTKTKSNPEFIKKVTGRYLFNSDEVVLVYYKNNELYLEWRGARNIKPLHTGDGTFFVKEMNEKIQFLNNPLDQQEYMVLVPKKENHSIRYNYRKLSDNEKIPSEYLKNNEFEKALNAYQIIKEKDSLDSAISETNLNALGYKELGENHLDYAINIFMINTKLYPTSSNVYDSLGEAFKKRGDTVKAIIYYKKAFELDSSNKRVKRNIDRLEKKE